MLQDLFYTLTGKNTPHTPTQYRLWQEITHNYGEKGRHYHTLAHLENLHKQLSDIMTLLQHPEAILFALFYHDVIYEATKQNNEEESAALATTRMKSIGVPAEITEKCTAIILATKTHISSSDSDTNYFTDADLSILGQSREAYLRYAKQVRQEYNIYPDLLYKPGRKKVLRHFLEMESIYKTPHFIEKYEVTARENMQLELDSL